MFPPAVRKIETDASCKRRRRQRRRQRLSRFTIIHNGERARDEGQSRGGRRVARPPRTGSPNLSTAPWQHGRSVAAGRSVDPTLMAVCLAIYAPNGPTPSFLPSFPLSLPCSRRRRRRRFETRGGFEHPRPPAPSARGTLARGTDAAVLRYMEVIYQRGTIETIAALAMREKERRMRMRRATYFQGAAV